MSKKNQIGSILLKIYSVLRSEWNPVVNKFLELKFGSLVPDLDFKSEMVPLSRDDFRKTIMSYEYKWDPFKGGLDFTYLHPKYFFWDALPFGRDCDDFSYMWYLWYRLSGSDSYQYVVVPNYDVKKSHVITVSIVAGKFVINDYTKEYEGENLTEVMDKYFEAMYAGKKSEKGKEYTSISYAVIRQSERTEVIEERIS